MLRRPVFSMTITGTSLHIAGRADLLKVDRAVGIVGSRAASRAGRERAFALACELAGSGWLVVSGGALGIDSAAHEGAMAAGAPTVAIVAGGVKRPYPERNAPLFQAILSSGGAIASPFADGEGIRRWHFVARNKVLAALVRAVVVVEAGARSGALHTAAAARLVGACPGSAGTESLLMD